MVASAFGEDGTGGRQSRLTVDDLKYLFMMWLDIHTLIRRNMVLGFIGLVNCLAVGLFLAVAAGEMKLSNSG